MKLIDRIYTDLAQKIIERRDLPTLTLPALAAHFSSSTRPVRQAVDKLIEHKLLIKSANGRLHVAENITKTLCGKIKKTLVTTDPLGINEERLLGKLIRYSIEGFQDYLREENMAEEFNIGRGNLRQFFSNYANRGLLEHVTHCGWKVIPFNETDMQHFIYTRQSLEDLALRESFSQLDHTIIRTSLENNKRTLHLTRATKTTKTTKTIKTIKTIALSNEDNSFHAYFVGISGNRYIQQFYDQHMPYYSIFSEWEGKDIQASISTAKEHCRILEAILDNNLSAARDALHTHLQFEHDFKSICTRLMDSE
ncbi:MAG: GntR family transcriptional regulator [Planctomycetes bacterium]|nr:GntR family transcriptional regulator [Planctomycetota bacterium]